MEPDPSATAMSAPKAADKSPALAQAVAAPLTRAAIFLVVTLKPGSGNRDLLRSFCGDLSRISPRRGIPRLGRRSFLRYGFWTGGLGSPLRAASAG